MPIAIAQQLLDGQARFVRQVGPDWALVTAGTERDGWNTMTIGWGSAGVLWGRPVVTVYVHPSRYTHDFLLNNELFTVQLFDSAYKRDLGILGSKSGRDGDKVALTSLTPRPLEGGMTFAEAAATLVCRKIYTHRMELDGVPDEIRARMGGLYAHEAHTAFVGELMDVLA